MNINKEAHDTAINKMRAILQVEKKLNLLHEQAVKSFNDGGPDIALIDFRVKRKFLDSFYAIGEKTVKQLFVDLTPPATEIQISIHGLYTRNLILVE